jgi:hypothetical protein
MAGQWPELQEQQQGSSSWAAVCFFAHADL